MSDMTAVPPHRKAMIAIGLVALVGWWSWRIGPLPYTRQWQVLLPPLVEPAFCWPANTEIECVDAQYGMFFYGETESGWEIHPNRWR